MTPAPAQAKQDSWQAKTRWRPGPYPERTVISYSYDPHKTSKKWNQVGNTLADGISQASEIIQDENASWTDWNFGSTLGNFYSSNPITAAIPGLVYSSATDPHNMKKNVANFVLDVSGNYLGDAIGKTSLLPGVKNGLTGFTEPLMGNIGSNIVINHYFPE